MVAVMHQAVAIHIGPGPTPSSDKFIANSSDNILEGFEDLQLSGVPCYPYEAAIEPKPPLDMDKKTVIARSVPISPSSPPTKPKSKSTNTITSPTVSTLEDKKALQAKDAADAALEEAAKAKAALKEAKKQARKERKKEGKAAKGDAPQNTSKKNDDNIVPPTAPPPLDIGRAEAETLETPGIPPSAFQLSSLKVLNTSADSLNLTPLPSTPALTATSSRPSLGSAPSFVSNQRPPSLSSFEDPVAAAKAAVKSAKLRAKQEAAAQAQANRVEYAAEQHSRREVQRQPWEIALDQIERPASEARKTRSSRVSVDAFKIPLDQQLLVDFDAPIPTTDFDTTHNVAAAIVENLVEKWGRWSITFLDPSYRIFITTDKRAALSFKVSEGLTNRVAVVFGDPVCDPIMMEEVITQFRAYCASRRWRTAFVGVTAAVAGVAELKRWTSVQFAVEQVVDPTNNVLLDGTKGKRMMVAIKKLVKDKVLRMYNPADGVDLVLQAYLQGVYDRSYAAKEASKGDTTAYSTKLALFDLPRIMTYFYTVGTDGLPNGVAGLMNVGEGRYLLDPVVSLPDAPRDTSDFLTLAAMGWLRRRNIRHMSFGLEPLREIGELHGLHERWHADTRLINAASFDAFGFAGKKMLHDKFYPDPSRQEKLYLVLGSRNCITQLDGALAITHATHLKATPVIRRLIWMAQAVNTGVVIEKMMGKLVCKGQLPKDPRSNDGSPNSSSSASSASSASSTMDPPA